MARVCGIEVELWVVVAAVLFADLFIGLLVGMLFPRRLRAKGVALPVAFAIPFFTFLGHGLVGWHVGVLHLPASILFALITVGPFALLLSLPAGLVAEFVLWLRPASVDRRPAEDVFTL